MSGRSTRVTLLGPQRLEPTVAAVLAGLGVDGPVATVTAGWKEREGDDRELDRDLGRRTRNLELYRRAEELFAHDRELARLHRARQDRLRELQELYRVRLEHARAAVEALWEREGGSDILDAERGAAMSAVRALDRRHLERVGEVHAEFEEEARLDERPSVTRARQQVGKILAEAEAVVIAGGHVALLLNRLRLFDLAGQLRGQRVVAWSAAAMALSDRVVLFHDSPPQGGGASEVIERGLGLVPDLVPLPHARRRLQLDDGLRVALFARRYAPALCVPMDGGARLDWTGRTLRPGEGMRFLDPNGSVRPLAPMRRV